MVLTSDKQTNNGETAKKNEYIIENLFIRTPRPEKIKDLQDRNKRLHNLKCRNRAAELRQPYGRLMTQCFPKKTQSTKEVRLPKKLHYVFYIHVIS